MEQPAAVDGRHVPAWRDERGRVCGSGGGGVDPRGVLWRAGGAACVRRAECRTNPSAATATVAAIAAATAPPFAISAASTIAARRLVMEQLAAVGGWRVPGRHDKRD
eukprot:7382970-Prymnesium_polylepis.1